MFVNILFLVKFLFTYFLVFKLWFVFRMLFFIYRVIKDKLDEDDFIIKIFKVYVYDLDVSELLYLYIFICIFNRFN